MGLFAHLGNIFSRFSKKESSDNYMSVLSGFVREKNNLEASVRVHGREGLLKDALQLCDDTIRYLQGRMNSDDWRRTVVLGPVTSSIMNHDQYKRDEIYYEAKKLWGYAHDSTIPDALLLRKTLELAQSIRRVENVGYYKKGA